MSHVLHHIKPNQEGFNSDEAVERCLHYIMDTVASQNCQRPPGEGKRDTACSCIKFLGEEENIAIARGVACFMVRWAGFDRNRKRELMHTWRQYASSYSSASRKEKYVFPQCITADPEMRIHENGQDLEQDSIMICRNALMGLLGIGHRMWKTAVVDPLAVHGNAGKRSNYTKMYEEVYHSLDDFFCNLANEGTPFATRIIREESGLTTRDDNPDEVALPPHMSKHRCYARWCWERGWKVSKKNRALTIYDNVKDFPMREHDDDCEVPLWPTGSEAKKIVTWCTFLNYWKANFPFIKVRKRGADTCTDCLVLANEFRIGTQQSSMVSTAIDDSHDDDDGGGSERMKDATEEANLEATISVMESLLLRAKLHVKQYQTQKKQKDQVILFA